MSILGKDYDVKTMSIHLQGVGRQQAMFAGEVKVGDELMWNGGSTSKVVSVREIGKAYIMIVEEYVNKFKNPGAIEQAERKMKKDRLVAYARRS